MSLVPCKHLDYSTNFPGCTIIERDGIKYWERTRMKEIDPSLPINVQFCKKCGRVNSILDCWESGFKACYEMEEEKQPSIPRR